MPRKFINKFLIGCVLISLNFCISACIAPVYITDKNQILNIDILKKQDISTDDILELTNNIKSDISVDNFPYVKKDNEIIIDRTHYDKRTLLIKKQGFNEYSLPLKKEITSEKWAKACFFNCSNFSAGKLFIFPGTLSMLICSVPSYGLSLLALPAFTVMDVANILQTPALPIINPWFEYNIPNQKIILEPTKELVKQCKKNSFISNKGCVSCEISDIEFASKAECDKCPIRIWSNFECKLSEWKYYKYKKGFRI